MTQRVVSWQETEAPSGGRAVQLDCPGILPLNPAPGGLVFPARLSPGGRPLKCGRQFLFSWDKHTRATAATVLVTCLRRLCNRKGAPSLKPQHLQCVLPNPCFEGSASAPELKDAEMLSEYLKSSGCGHVAGSWSPVSSSQYLAVDKAWWME